MSDKSVIFIYCGGMVIMGKISDEIINNELIESIENLVEKLSIDEKIKLRQDISKVIWND